MTPRPAGGVLGVQHHHGPLRARLLQGAHEAAAEQVVPGGQPGLSGADHDHGGAALVGGGRGEAHAPGNDHEPSPIPSAPDGEAQATATLRAGLGPTVPRRRHAAAGSAIMSP